MNLFAYSAYAIIGVIAAYTAFVFYMSRNGILRKIMIVKFSTITYRVAISAVYFTKPFCSFDKFLFYSLLPELIVMIWLLHYLKHKK
jgi:hypothetical protein